MKLLYNVLLRSYGYYERLYKITYVSIVFNFISGSYANSAQTFENTTWNTR